MIDTLYVMGTEYFDPPGMRGARLNEETLRRAAWRILRRTADSESDSEWYHLALSAGDLKVQGPPPGPVGDAVYVFTVAGRMFPVKAVDLLDEVLNDPGEADRR